MLLKKLMVGSYKTNCYILADSESRDCVVIDPGAEVYTILQALDEDGLQLRGILLTHAHFDHFGAMWPLYDRRPATVYVHKNDLAPIVNTGPQRFVPPPSTQFIEDGDELIIGSLRIGVIACPGHTPGGVSYVCGALLFTGDTLFHMDYGYIGGACGDANDMTASLEKLRLLPGNYRLLPGHMDESTLDYEREHNAYLQTGVRICAQEPDEEAFSLGKI